MQTIEEYKEYAKQLEGQLHDKNEDMKAYMVERDLLLKDNVRLKHEIERLERERVEQNSIIETCANELEELRLHEVEWDLAKARIKELEESQRWRKCSEELPEEGVEVLVTNGIDCEISDWCGDYWNNDPFCGYTVCDNVIAWMPLPATPKEDK